MALYISKQEAIKTIEHSYPADTGYNRIRMIGRQLLLQARNGVEPVLADWRDEELPVLQKYAELVVERNNEMLIAINSVS